MLEQILDDMRARYPNLTFIFVAGDEQTYDRMIKLKSDDLNGYKWLIPLPGDFHVAGHILMGIYRLYWTSVLSFFLTPLQRDKVTKDFLMSKFNRHEEYFLHVVLGVMKWFRHCFGASCLEYPADLKDQCKDNYTSTVLWHFLFEKVCLPLCRISHDIASVSYSRASTQATTVLPLLVRTSEGSKQIPVQHAFRTCRICI